jgi:hypothetical protein
MDHEATREELELAAVEPGGLERLMAGDTPAAAAVAAHLAGCPSCSDEAARLQLAATLVKRAIRVMPSPDLRERTMAAVRAQGVPRPLPASAAGVSADAGTVTAPAGPDEITADAPIRLARRRPIAPLVGWAATVAAAVILSMAATWLLVGARVDGQLASQAESISALEEVTSATLAVTARPDAEHVFLAGVSDPMLDGSLAYSPSSSDLVVVANGLTPPAAGLEYRCWVEIGGQRHPVGKMFFSPHLAYWVGPVSSVVGLASGATFGVSLVGPSVPVDSAPVLLGKL